jgi:hypothetical protein
LVAAAVLVIIAAAWFGGGALRVNGSSETIERIAVLPMDNQTGDSGQAFFADGMTRELIGGRAAHCGRAQLAGGAEAEGAVVNAVAERIAARGVAS